MSGISGVPSSSHTRPGSLRRQHQGVCENDTCASTEFPPGAGVRIVDGTRRASTPLNLSTRMVSRAIAGVQVGDREALGFLYARYADEVFDCVRDILGDEDEGENTRQVFAELIWRIGDHEPHEEPFSTWIEGVARELSSGRVGRQT